MPRDLSAYWIALSYGLYRLVPLHRKLYLSHYSGSYINSKLNFSICLLEYEGYEDHSRMDRTVGIRVDRTMFCNV